MTDPRTRAARSYLEAKVRGASPAELILILYEGLARELRLAACSLEKEDCAAGGLAIGSSLGIIGQLRTSLNHQSGGDVATNLERLYVYWTRRVTEANIAVSRVPLDEVITHVEELRKAWYQGLVNPASEPASTPEPADEQRRGAPMVQLPSNAIKGVSKEEPSSKSLAAAGAPLKRAAR